MILFPSFSSINKVKFSTVSINFLGFIKDGKKSKFEDLIYDRALSWVYGTTKKDNRKETIIKPIENIIILFKNIFYQSDSTNKLIIDLIHHNKPGHKTRIIKMIIQMFLLKF